ncbi:MAG: non-homologous end-joining DNA ligase [Limnochordia bacterium]|nr:non-homologous end-joining DNA ligase [Limnochordia bacterium]
MRALSLRPMLPANEPVPRDEVGFIHEIKWDGYRLLSYLDGGDVQLISRNGYSFNDRFPNLAEYLRKKDLQAVLDGEVVALTKEGRVDFSLLQSRNSGIDICYVVFDVLRVRGEDLCPRPWFERRRRLEEMIQSEGPLLVSPLLSGSASDCLSFAIEQGFEGIVSKREDSPYLPGVRTSYWFKQKILRTLDCLLVGVKVDRRSVAVAVYRGDGALVYLGNVGSGLGQGELGFLTEALETLGKLTECPCINPPRDAHQWTWCKPLLVLEVEYLEFTSSGRLRHPVFLRFRFDKEPQACLMEV